MSTATICLTVDAMRAVFSRVDLDNIARYGIEHYAKKFEILEAPEPEESEVDDQPIDLEPYSFEIEEPPVVKPRVYVPQIPVVTDFNRSYY